MGQKVNPHGFRVGVIKDWDSRWFTKDENFGDTLVSDYKIREFLKNKYRESGVPKIEIERDNNRVRVFLHCAKPGIIIGRGGAEIEKLRLQLEAMVGMPTVVNVVEVKNPDINAQLVAESIAKQLEGRASFRRTMKLAIQRTMRMGAKGIKVTCSGRLAGAEIARTEHYHEGSIPLQTLRADIDYGFAEANTTYGKIGVKVWVYKGEVLRDSGRSSTSPRRRSRPRSRKDAATAETVAAAALTRIAVRAASTATVRAETVRADSTATVRADSTVTARTAHLLHPLTKREATSNVNA